MKYVFSIFLLLLLVFTLSASYLRFMVQHDFMVTYEFDCDPDTSSCYVGCEDDECTEFYYYYYVTRHTNSVLEQCGEDITDCDEAGFCQEDEEGCEIEFCDPEDIDNECSELVLGNETES